MTKPDSALKIWALERFGGSTPTEGVRLFAESLVQQTGQFEPPVRLVAIARLVGVNPKPIYRNMAQSGGLEKIEGQLRIVLKSVSQQPPPVGSTTFMRMRFTYAHETAHGLFFDSDGNRIAPNDDPKLEEEMCNYAAGRFLIPQFMLRRFQFLDAQSELVPETLFQLAKLFQVSFHAFLLQVEEVISTLLKPGGVYILSRMERNRNEFGRSKPRCVVCIMAADAKRGRRSLLAGYEGVDHIKRVDERDDGGWSLEQFFRLGSEQQQPTRFTPPCEEILICPGKRQIRLVSRHRRLPGTAYIWTEAVMEDWQNT